LIISKNSDLKSSPLLVVKRNENEWLDRNRRLTGQAKWNWNWWLNWNKLLKRDENGWLNKNRRLIGQARWNLPLKVLTFL
jgi:hypothetical protein